MKSAGEADSGSEDEVSIGKASVSVFVGSVCSGG